MSAALPLFAELEDAMSGSSSERRTDVLRQVTDLFLAAPGDYSEVQSALFDDIIMRLAENIESAAKIELARRLAPAMNAPVRIIMALADDDLIDIAEPVLRQSERLSDADLVQYARQKGPDHLLAISQRNSLSEAITDALLARDDHQVTRSVAENRGASFSDSGFGILVERSKRNDDLAESVARRHDIPPAHLRGLIAKASETVRRKLAADYPTGKIHEVLAEITGGLEAEARGLQASGDGGRRDYTAAVAAVGSLRADGRLDDRMVYEFAKTGRLEETLGGAVHSVGDTDRDPGRTDDRKRRLEWRPHHSHRQGGGADLADREEHPGAALKSAWRARISTRPKSNSSVCRSTPPAACCASIRCARRSWSVRSPDRHQRAVHANKSATQPYFWLQAAGNRLSSLSAR